MIARGFRWAETLIFSNRLSCAREPKPNSLLTHRTGRKLLASDEGHFVFAAVLFVPDEVEAGFRHHFPRLEFFLWHILLERRGTVVILPKYRVAAQKFESCRRRTAWGVVDTSRSLLF